MKTSTRFSNMRMTVTGLLQRISHFVIQSSFEKSICQSLVQLDTHAISSELSLCHKLGKEKKTLIFCKTSVHAEQSCVDIHTRRYCDLSCHINCILSSGELNREGCGFQLWDFEKSNRLFSLCRCDAKYSLARTTRSPVRCQVAACKCLT